MSKQEGSKTLRVPMLRVGTDSFCRVGDLARLAQSVATIRKREERHRWALQPPIYRKEGEML